MGHFTSSTARYSSAVAKPSMVVCASYALHTHCKHKTKSYEYSIQNTPKQIHSQQKVTQAHKDIMSVIRDKVPIDASQLPDTIKGTGSIRTISTMILKPEARGKMEADAQKYVDSVEECKQLEEKELMQQDLQWQQNVVKKQNIIPSYPKKMIGTTSGIFEADKINKFFTYVPLTINVLETVSSLYNQELQCSPYATKRQNDLYRAKLNTAKLYDVNQQNMEAAYQGMMASKAIESKEQYNLMEAQYYIYQNKFPYCLYHDNNHDQIIGKDGLYVVDKLYSE